ncbi:DUF2325 domain-containing protein [Thermosulfuriphilus ammonigenes]|uniref:DUF2325 domain-containing protein n=1 Tax=Thermosulfuriphilus ammonigenes TaxID=1936021 RepID=A0A6G7PUK1_9BACT|nr:DUF2325 domain-containing protein [Thermosulfuriphilus ammonigenes]MBA2848487.1 ABC-type uncharacterized transport system substrate-binding protein [Thermosulfuriphilus ammonigenes]QIJ71364.1 DUF2325 domain-containing protein [Thermosulfuriphilus ammonigenes]
MCVVLVGGMDRLRKEYETEARKKGIELRVYSRLVPRLSRKIKNVDAIILFTNKVSHEARKQVLTAHRENDIPLIQLHSCGLSSLKRCLAQLTAQA